MVLIKSIVRAHNWFEQSRSGDVSGTAEIAASEGLTQSYVTLLMRLTFLVPLVPDIIEAMPVDLSADKLVKSSAGLAIDWEEQRVALGL